MYLKNSELNVFELIIGQMQSIVDSQEAHQNQLFPEGIFYVRERLNEAEKIAETIRNREVVSRAKKIVRQRRSQAE